MRIATFTSGSIKVASSRLRSFYVFESKIWDGYDVVFNPSLWSFYRYNYIHLQKRYSPRFLLMTLFARILGKKVIFDIDDQVTKITHHIAVYIIILLSSVVTTDTGLRRDYLKRISKKKSIYVIPDVLDISSNKKIFEPSYPIGQSRAVIIWVGNVDNFNSFKVLIESDPRLEEFKIIIVTNAQHCNEIELQHKSYTVKQWNLNWTDSLAPCNSYYMVLNHEDPECKNAIYKSDNKMATAICRSIIPIVSKTPAYYSLAKEIEAEDLVFDQPNFVYDIIKKIDARSSSWKQSFFTRSISFIEHSYNKNSIASDLLKIITRCR